MKLECEGCGSTDHGAEFNSQHGGGLTYFVCFKCCRATSVAVRFLFDKDDDFWWVKSEWPKSNTWLPADAEYREVLDGALDHYLAKLIVT